MRKPMTPAGCDLRDFPRMMIDIPRLRASAFDATPDDAAWRAALNLWFSSWHGDPAASLECDEASLCKAAGLGRDLRTWRKVRAVAMRGWEECEDGKFYHETVAEFALEAWLEKLAQRLSSGAGNAKRWGTVFDPAPIERDMAIAVGLLIEINPQSKALPKASRRLSKPHPDGTDDQSQRDGKTIPTGSQETGTGKGIEEEPPTPPRGDEVASPAFERAWSAYPIAGRGNHGRSSALVEWPAASATAGGEDRLADATVARAAHLAKNPTERPKALHRWLRDGGFEAYLAAPAATWSGPPDVWDTVVAAMTPAFAQSYLTRCAWRSSPVRAVVAPNGFVRDKLADGRSGEALNSLGIQIIVEKAA